MAVTFLQSGYDKIIDWKGNVGWLKSHFANTFLGDKVPFSLGIILILEIIAGSLFLGLTFVVFSTKADFSFLRSILAIGFFVAIGAIVAGMLFDFDLGLWFSIGMIVLASGSILYNTHQIKNQFGTNQYIAAALSLFASLMLLFWYVLRLLMSRN